MQKEAKNNAGGRIFIGYFRLRISIQSERNSIIRAADEPGEHERGWNLTGGALRTRKFCLGADPFRVDSLGNTASTGHFVVGESDPCCGPAFDSVGVKIHIKV